jgi:exopolysaccharide production protein ExoZ
VIFYLGFTLLIINAWLGAIAFTAWGGVVLAHAFGVIDIDLPFKLSSPFCFEFLVGVASGVLTRKKSFKTSFSTLSISLLSFAAATVFEVYGPLGRNTWSGRFALGLASAAILISLLGLERQNSLRVPKWMVTFGSASYSIYLGHVLFIGLTYSALFNLGLYHRLPESLLLVLALASSLAATLVIGLYVELPLVSTLKKCWDIWTSRTPKIEFLPSRGLDT